MRRAKRQIGFVIMVILTVCFYVLGVHQMQRLEEEIQHLSFVSTGENDFLPPMYEKNQEGMLWSERSGSVENKMLYRTSDTTVLALHGRSDMLFPNEPVIDVNSIKSCLLSQALAYELFGSENVEGLTVTYEGKDFEVVGMIEQSGNVFVYEPDESENMSYQRVTLKNTETKAINVLNQELQMKYPGGMVLDYTLIKLILEVYLLTLPIILSVILLRLLRKFWKASNRRIERYVWVGAFVVMTVVVGGFVLKNIHIPLDMIPDKWSDFEFWTRWLEEKQETLLFLMKIPKTVIDMRVLEALKGLVLYNSLALVCFCALNKKIFMQIEM